MKRSKRVLCLLVALVLLINALPVPMAAESTHTPDTAILSQAESIADSGEDAAMQELQADEEVPPEPSLTPEKQAEPGEESSEPEELFDEGQPENPAAEEPIPETQQESTMTALYGAEDDDLPLYKEEQPAEGNVDGWADYFDVYNYIRLNSWGHYYRWFGTEDNLSFRAVAEYNDWIGL